MYVRGTVSRGRAPELPKDTCQPIEGSGVIATSARNSTSYGVANSSLFPRPAVHLVRDEVQISLREPAQVRALREVLTHPQILPAGMIPLQPADHLLRGELLGKTLLHQPQQLGMGRDLQIFGSTPALPREPVPGRGPILRPGPGSGAGELAADRGRALPNSAAIFRRECPPTSSSLNLFRASSVRNRSGSFHRAGARPPVSLKYPRNAAWLDPTTGAISLILLPWPEPTELLDPRMADHLEREPARAHHNSSLTCGVATTPRIRPRLPLLTIPHPCRRVTNAYSSVNTEAGTR